MSTLFTTQAIGKHLRSLCITKPLFRQFFARTDFENVVLNVAVDGERPLICQRVENAST